MSKHDLRAMYDTKYIGAWDLVDKAGNPRDYTMEIVSVREEKLTSHKDGKKAVKRMPILTFAGAEKEFALGAKTNRDTIGALYGYKVKDLVGKLITLYATTTLAFGKVVDCVRIRPERPTRKGETLESRPVDEAMRAKQTEAAEGAQ